ncbi:MAG: hypothetical protein J0H51_22390, partial [Rhizobiales bacterium]|nr:hypothetical protein [Hyphomicrobiales bacterium]
MRRNDCTHETYLADIAVLLGGIAAEEIFLGCRSDGAGGGPGTDLYLATVKATLMEASVGLGGRLTYRSSRDEADLLASLRISATNSQGANIDLIEARNKT